MKLQVLLVLVLLGCPILETARCDQTNTVHSLGVSVVPVITNGMVFIDGEYIPPPYRIRRDGGAVMLNDVVFIGSIIPPALTPISQPDIPPETDTRLSSEITETTAFEDRAVQKYLKNKRLYLLEKFGEESGIDRMVEVCQKLPMVAVARRADKDGINVWVKGEQGMPTYVRQRNFPDWGAMKRLTPAESIWNLEASSHANANMLNSGAVLMFGVPWRVDGIATPILPSLASALRAAHNEAEFIAIMQTNMPPGGIPEQGLKNFWKHREQAPVWEARAKQLYAEWQEANLSREEGIEALDAFIRAAPSADALIATLQAKRPRLLDRIVGKDAEGNPISSQGLFTEQELREFFKNRNNPEGWRPKPPPPYKPPSEIIATISSALAKAKTETEFRAALAGKFIDADWHGGFATWDKYFTFIWEHRNRPRYEWSGEPSALPSVSTNTPLSEDPAYVW